MAPAHCFIPIKMPLRMCWGWWCGGLGGVAYRRVHKTLYVRIKRSLLPFTKKKKEKKKQCNNFLIWKDPSVFWTNSRSGFFLDFLKKFFIKEHFKHILKETAHWIITSFNNNQFIANLASSLPYHFPHRHSPGQMKAGCLNDEWYTVKCSEVEQN